MPAPALWAVLVLAALAFAARYPYALHIPFINDDYVFLEKTRAASFWSLWSTHDLTFHWYRPWSRELHYWILQRVFGTWEPGYHLASLALLLAVIGAYFALARRVAGAVAAAIATAGLAAMSAWAVPALWVAGVQELWLLFFCLASLHALARGRIALSALAAALALLSKESAAVLPALALLYLRVVERRPWRAAAARVTPHAALVLVWAAFHPLLGGRLWHPLADAPTAAAGSPAVAALRTVLAPLNLDALPAPANGAWALLYAVPSAAILAGLVLWASRASRGAGVRPPRAIVVFGLGWALIGWLPVLMPSLGWHAYYTLLGALGAWLALGAALGRAPAPAAAAAALVAACALLGGACAATPSRDWGTAWYQRRAGSFLRFMRDDLKRTHPRFPPHSRLFFFGVPNNVGFITHGGPALRVWYGDSTLAGGFFSGYRRRPPGRPGEDFFFRYDTTAGWIEIARGEEDLAAARRANPRWESDHRRLAAALARAEDWAGTAEQYRKLAAARPGNAEYSLNAGVCYEMLRDSAQAAAFYRRVLDLPGAPADARAFAEQFPRRWQARRDSS